MKPDQVKNILRVASSMPVGEARRVVGLLAKDTAPDEMQPFRDALAEDLKPLGKAMWDSYQAGDFAATVAALRKVSRNMPNLVEATRLEAALTEKMANALTEESPQ